jgi:hypothetical protein
MLMAGILRFSLRFDLLCIEIPDGYGSGGVVGSVARIGFRLALSLAYLGPEASAVIGQPALGFASL